MTTPSPGPSGEVLFRGRRFRVERVPQPCADGSVRDREVVVHPGSVVVVPLVTPATVCLVEVVRVAVGKTLLELPAGTQASHAEVKQPRYRRVFTLSQALDADGISAELRQGVLTLRIPIAAHARPRRIEVQD